MKNTFWDKRIPTILSVTLIGISIVITSILVKNSTVFVSRADITESPQNVKITNILDTSFTISFVTEAESIALVNFDRSENLGQTAIEDRDQKEVIRPRKIHNFTLKNLRPDTRYFFTITSGDNTFFNNNLPYETRTASIPQTTLTPQTPIKGKIVLPDGSSPNEALVYVNTDKAQEISSLADNNGLYSLPLSSLLLKDLSYPVILDKQDIIKMIITNGHLKSNVWALASQTNPVPVITLSQDYDFTLSPAQTSSKSSDLSGFASILSQPTPPSASPTPSRAPVALPSSTPTPTLTPSPTIVVPTSTPIPTPITVVSPTISPKTPLGNPSILITGIFGLFITVLGFLLFIKTRGGTSSKWILL